MGFSSEAEMKGVAKRALQNGVVDEPKVLMDEFTYANGRADLVLAKASEAYLERRTENLDITSSITDDTYLKVFLHIHGRGAITKEHFFSIGALNRSAKKAALNWLIEENFVEELEDGKIRSAPNLRRHITTSYSIELKLSKWKKGLQQAIRGKSFSDYQFVAIAEDNVLRAIENIEMFEDNDIGLMEISQDGDYFIHYHPENRNGYSLTNKWRLNERTITQEQEYTANPSQHAAGD